MAQCRASSRARARSDAPKSNPRFEHNWPHGHCSVSARKGGRAAGSGSTRTQGGIGDDPGQETRRKRSPRREQGSSTTERAPDRRGRQPRRRAPWLKSAPSPGPLQTCKRLQPAERIKVLGTENKPRLLPSQCGAALLPGPTAAQEWWRQRIERWRASNGRRGHRPTQPRLGFPTAPGSWRELPGARA